jgi:ribose-phosphate pyrophosphokinase
MLPEVIDTESPAEPKAPSPLDENIVRFFAGSSHRALAYGIARYLGVPLDDTRIDRFSNDNLYVQLGASVRGRFVFIVQSLVPPVSDNLMELLMMLDAARGAGAREIHAIIPYFSYARSDKKDAPRISITARLVADMLAMAGATHVMTMTLHSPQVHGFFSVPTDPLTARACFLQHFGDRGYTKDDTIVVAPDIGHAKAAARFATRLGLPMAAGDKTRTSDHNVEVGALIGQQVKGYRRAIIYDDEIATGGSMLKVSGRLIDAGVKEIILVCTHGLFAGDASQRIAAVPQISEVVTTDTVPLPPERRLPNMKIISVAPVFGDAIWKNCHRQSIGDLFSFADPEDK